MPPVSLTRNYDAVLSACLDAFIGKDPVDNIFKDHVLLAVAKDKGMLSSQSGGYKFRVPIMYATNSTVGSYTSYDVLDTTPQDEFTTAFYDKRQLSASISISGIEEAQNRSEAEIFDLLRGKTEVALQSLRQELNYQLLGKTVASAVWSAGAGPTASTTSTDVDPIPEALSRDPTQSVAVGEINKNTYSWWRAISADLSADAAGYNNQVHHNCDSLALVLHHLNSTYYWCSRGGGGRPDVMIASQGAFEIVEAAMRTNVRYTSTDNASVGFDNIAFKAGCPLYWDEMMPDIETGTNYETAASKETIYLLNTKFMTIRNEEGKNFVPTPFVRPENQDAKVAQILWYGNLCWSALRKHGVAYGIDGTLES